MIEVVDGLFVRACYVVAVKSAGAGKSILYLKGQPPLEIDGEALDIADKVDEALEEED